MKRAPLEENAMVIGQAEVAELVRDGKALVSLVLDSHRIEDSERTGGLKKATGE